MKTLIAFLFICSAIVVGVVIVSDGIFNALLILFFLFIIMEILIAANHISRKKGKQSGIRLGPYVDEIIALTNPIVTTPPKFFQGHAYALYIRTPNGAGKTPSNNLGYVDKKDITTNKSNNVARIYCVGGSTMETIDPEQGPDSHWPAKLQERLNQKLADENVVMECINASASGYTSIESLIEFAL